MASNDDDLSAVVSQSPTAAPDDDLKAVMTPAAPQPPTSLWNKANYYAGLFDRGVMQGLGSIPSVVGDQLVTAYNSVARHEGLPQSPMNVSQAINKGADYLGLAQPKNLPESLITSGTSTLASMAVPIPFLDKLQPGTSQKLLNNIWSKAIGEDSSKVTSEVLNKADERIGDVFNSVRDATPRQINVEGVNKVLTNLDSEYQGLLGADGRMNVTDHPLVQKFMSLATDPSGAATGEQLGKVSSQLGKAATKQFLTGDYDMGKALSSVKEVADDIVQQGLSPEEAAAYSGARSQYRAMTQMLRSRALNVDTGDINPNTMGSFLERTDRHGYALGNNQADHYAVTHAMRAQNAPSTGLGMLQQFKPAGVPVGPALAGAYKAGLVPKAFKGAAGAYEGLSGPEDSQ